MDMAAAIGIDLLTVEQYRNQKLTVADEEIFNRIFTTWSQSESYRWREKAQAAH